MDYAYDKREERLYLAAYTLWMISALWNLSLWNELACTAIVRHYLQNTAYLLLLIKFFSKKRYTAKDTAGIAMLIFCCALASHAYYHRHIIAAAILIYSAGNVRLSKILKCNFVIQSVFMAATIGASSNGLLKNVIWYEGERVRYSLGYAYCTYPSHLLFFLTLTWFCLQKKIRIFDSLLFAGMNYLMYLQTDTRTNFYLSLFAIAGFFIWNRNLKWPVLLRIRDWFTCYGFIPIAVISIALHWFFNPNIAFMAKLNTLFNTRLQLGHDAIQNYGFSLFGKDLQWFGQGSLKANPSLVYNYVDCSFLKETLNFGILFLFLIAVLFYLTGKKLSEAKAYPLSWAILIMLVHSSFNADLCMPVFNVFLLSNGILFTDNQTENASKSPAQIIAETCSRFIHNDSRSFFRTIIFLAFALYLVFLQHQDIDFIVRNRCLYIWIANGTLFLLSALCCEPNNGSPTAKLKKSLPLQIFLILVCISDFIFNKYYRYSGFSLLTFGGLFCCSWHSMEDPEVLLDDIKHALKLFFIAALICCLISRPAFFTICYSGIFTNASAFGICLLIILVVFFNDSFHKPPRFLDITCAVITCYLIWITRQPTIILIAAFLLLYYLFFFAAAWKQSGPLLRRLRLKKIGKGLITGIAACLLIAVILHSITPQMGFGISYANDTVQSSKIVFSALSGDNIKDVVRDLLAEKWEICREYLNDLNLIGHPSFLKIDGTRIWPPNSILINLYRYGIPAGISYAVIILLYLFLALWQSIKNRDFFLFGMMTTCVFFSMMETAAIPFVSPAWIMFYFSLGWLMVSSPQSEAKSH